MSNTHSTLRLVELSDSATYCRNIIAAIQSSQILIESNDPAVSGICAMLAEIRTRLGFMANDITEIVTKEART